MARVAGVDLPREKRLEIALTYIYGVGRTTSKEILAGTGLSADLRAKDLTDEVALGVYLSQALYNLESAAVAELEEFLGKSIRLQADDQYAQEQFDVVLL